ncbi:hypothetical protein niasHS_003174 [Heterodera schachtii]|uniref:Uncharacterized protein n=1 Tax=Heterodera schachtii TaxID=97005 RepID=A0ABD2KFQ0_HETSC
MEDQQQPAGPQPEQKFIGIEHEQEIILTKEELELLSVKQASRAVVSHFSSSSEPEEIWFKKDGSGETKRRLKSTICVDKEQLLHNVEFLFAAKLGAEIVNKTKFSGSGDDIKEATKIVVYMVREGAFFRHETGMCNFNVAKMGPETEAVLNDIIDSVLAGCEQRVSQLIISKKTMIKALADLLAGKPNFRMGKDEIQQFFSQYEADQLPPGGEGEEQAMR